jgi:hypothetical protein
MRPVDLQGILCALVELCFHRPVGSHSGGVSAQASALAHSEDSLGDGRTNIHIENPVTPRPETPSSGRHDQSQAFN